MAGSTGQTGPAGTSVIILGSYANSGALIATHPTGAICTITKITKTSFKITVYNRGGSTYSGDIDYIVIGV